jgi:hypothetical protein
MRAWRIFLVLASIAALGAVPIALANGATPTAPVVATSPAADITDTGVTLHGTVDPEGQPTNYAFQWGPTSGYGHETPLASAGAGAAAVAKAQRCPGCHLAPAITTAFSP